MPYTIVVELRKNGRRAVYAEIPNVDVIERTANDNNATFRFHVAGKDTETLGFKTALTNLDANEKLTKLFSEPLTGEAPTKLNVLAAKPAVEEPGRDDDNTKGQDKV